jgi:CRISPR type I-E-associated protein CasB/Cse2
MIIKQREETQSRSKSRDLYNIINPIAHAISTQRISKGDLAELRRVNNNDFNRPSFWKIITSYISDSDSGEYPSTDKLRRWAVMLAGMARMAPNHHDLNIKLGVALARNNFPESRLLRLLRSSSSTFFDNIQRMCIFLASKGQKTNWVEVAELILTRDTGKKERIRERIAMDYYGKQGQEENNNE